MNKKIFDFVWNHKPAKIKKSTLIKSKKEGGLEIKDFVIFDKALKLNWVNRLCSDHDAPWKYIPTSLLANVGGAFLFQCNYDCKLLCLSEHLPRFYKDIITYWQKIAVSCPQNKVEVLNQVIWNNRFLIVDKKSIYFPRWHQTGIIYISDLFDAEKNCFLSFNSLCEKYNAKFNFLQYYSMLSSVPASWKKLLNSSERPHIASVNSISDLLSCKALYEKLLSLETLPPPTAEKKLI